MCPLPYHHRMWPLCGNMTVCSLSHNRWAHVLSMPLLPWLHSAPSSWSHDAPVAHEIELLANQITNTVPARPAHFRHGRMTATRVQRINLCATCTPFEVQPVDFLPMWPPTCSKDETMCRSHHVVVPCAWWSGARIVCSTATVATQRSVVQER